MSLRFATTLYRKLDSSEGEKSKAKLTVSSVVDECFGGVEFTTEQLLTARRIAIERILQNSSSDQVIRAVQHYLGGFASRMKQMAEPIDDAMTVRPPRYAVYEMSQALV